MVNQIKKNAEDIEQRLETIRQTNVFKPCPVNYLGELPRCKVCHSARLVDYVIIILLIAASRKEAKYATLPTHYWNIGLQRSKIIIITIIIKFI